MASPFLYTKETIRMSFPRSCRPEVTRRGRYDLARSISRVNSLVVIGDVETCHRRRMRADEMKGCRRLHYRENPVSGASRQNSIFRLRASAIDYHLYRFNYGRLLLVTSEVVVTQRCGRYTQGIQGSCPFLTLKYTKSEAQEGSSNFAFPISLEESPGICFGKW